MAEVKNIYVDIDDSYNQNNQQERSQLNFITITIRANVDGEEIIQQYDVSSDGVTQFNDEGSQGEEIDEITGEAQRELAEYIEKHYDSDGNPIEGIWAEYDTAWEYALDHCRKSVLIEARSMVDSGRNDDEIINWVINNGWQRRVVDAIRSIH